MLATRRVVSAAARQRRWFSDASTCWEVLGVDPARDAVDPKVLSAKYKQLAKRWHPDVAGGCVRKMKVVNAAFAEAKRRVADGDLSSHTHTPGGADADADATPHWTRRTARDAGSGTARGDADEYTALHEFIQMCRDALAWLRNPRFSTFVRVNWGQTESERRRGADFEARWARSAKRARDRGDSGSSTAANGRERWHEAHDAEHAAHAEARRERGRKLRFDKKARETPTAKASRMRGVKDDLLEEAEGLVQKLHVPPPAWLWHNRERADVETISRGVRALTRQWAETEQDRRAGAPLAEKRRRWYAVELQRAAVTANNDRMGLLVGVLGDRRAAGMDDVGAELEGWLVLWEDKTGAAPLSAERKAWYHRELEAAVAAGDAKRRAVLMDVLTSRGDIDIMEFEDYM